MEPYELISEAKKDGYLIRYKMEEDQPYKIEMYDLKREERLRQSLYYLYDYIYLELFEDEQTFNDDGLKWMIEFIESESKRKNRKILLGIRKPSRLSLELKEYIEKKHYIFPEKETMEKIKELIGIEHENIMIKKEELKEMSEEFTVIYSFANVIKNLPKKIKNANVSFGQDYKVTYLEKKITFSLQKSGLKFFVAAGEKKVEITEISDIKKCIMHTMEEIKKKERLRSLFHPPMYHFDNMVYILGIKKIGEKIYSTLRGDYSPIEIDELSAEIFKMQKNDFPFESIDQSHSVLKFGHHLMWIDMEKMNIIKFENTPENQKVVVEMSKELFENRVKRIF